MSSSLAAAAAQQNDSWQAAAREHGHPGFGSKELWLYAALQRLALAGAMQTRLATASCAARLPIDVVCRIAGSYFGQLVEKLPSNVGIRHLGLTTLVELIPFTGSVMTMLDISEIKIEINEAKTLVDVVRKSEIQTIATIVRGMMDNSGPS